MVGAGDDTFFLVNERFELEIILKIIECIKKLDYIVIEGFKFSNYPKISTTEVTDDFTISNVDVFEINDEDVINLVNLVEERTYGLIPGSDCGNCGYDNCLDMARDIIKGKISEDKCKMKKLDEVQLFIGDKMVPLNPFVQDFMKKV